MCCSYFGYDFRNLAADINNRIIHYTACGEEEIISEEEAYRILALELVNTAVEATVDLFTEERKPLAKKAKDAAAGAVLIVAIFAAVIGILIFIPKLLDVAGL